MRVTDVFLAVPQLILALALAQLMTPSLESAMLALALTYWPFFTRIVYAETRRLWPSLFVDALRGIGAGDAAHRVPAHPAELRCRRSSCARRSGMGFTILVAAVLGFLGMGATPPATRLGPDHRRKPHLPAARLVVLRSSRVSRSWSRCWASTCWATACATSSTRACGARDDRRAGLDVAESAPRCRSAPTRASRASSTMSIFALEPGHILGVVGESGCGKSTVIRAILGILPQGAPVDCRQDPVRGREPAGLLARTS